MIRCPFHFLYYIIMQMHIQLLSIHEFEKQKFVRNQHTRNYPYMYTSTLILSIKRIIHFHLYTYSRPMFSIKGNTPTHTCFCIGWGGYEWVR